MQKETKVTRRYKVVIMYGRKRESNYLKAESIYDAETMAKKRAEETNGRFLSAVVCYDSKF
jgi:hypothetical protein